MTSVLSTAPPQAHGATGPSGRDRFHAGACVLSGLCLIAGMALMPEEPEDYSASTLFPVIQEAPDRYFAAHLLFALGLVLMAAVGLAVLRLTPSRGRVLGTIGGLLFAVAGTSAAAAIWAYGAYSTAIATSGLSGASIDPVFAAYEDSMRIGMGFFLGFPPLLPAFVLSGLALWRARAVPVWAAALLAASIVAPIAGEDGLLGALLCLPMLVAFTVVARALLVRRTASS